MDSNDVKETDGATNANPVLETEGALKADENDINTVYDSPTQTVVELEDVKPFGFFKRIVSVFIAPARLMENIKEKPALLQPIIALLLLYIPVAFLSLKASELYLAFMGDYLSKYGIDYAAMQTASASGAGNVAGILGGYGGAIGGSLIGGLISALIIFILCKIARGEGKFKQYFSMLLHVYIMGAVMAIFSTGLQIAFGTMLDFTSLAAVFMPNGNISMPVFSVLSAVSVSTIWSAFIQFIGIKTFNGFGTVRAGVITILLFAGGVLYTAAMASGTIMMMDLIFSAMPM